ncbi:hypothetical protein CU097_002648, partial [Rhizopus azygosporus]
SIHLSTNNINPSTSTSLSQKPSSNPVSKIPSETTTHSKINNQEPISSSPSTASTKRTLSDRSPQLQPLDQVSRPHRKIKSHNIDFIMNPIATTFDFGPTQQPNQQPPALTVDQPLDFGLPSSVPDWFRPFQARLLHVESLVQENQRLREELTAAQTRIAELEATQTKQQQQPKSRVGTEASKWKTTTATPTAKPAPPAPQPTATPAPYKAAALKGKKATPPAPKPSTTRPRKALSTRQLQV